MNTFDTSLIFSLNCIREMKIKNDKAEELERSYVHTLASLEASDAVSARYEANVNYEWDSLVWLHNLSKPPYSPLRTTAVFGDMIICIVQFMTIMLQSNSMLNKAFLQSHEDCLLFQGGNWAQAELISIRKREDSGLHGVGDQMMIAERACLAIYKLSGLPSNPTIS